MEMYRGHVQKEHTCDQANLELPPFEWGNFIEMQLQQVAEALEKSRMEEQTGPERELPDFQWGNFIDMEVQRAAEAKKNAQFRATFPECSVGRLSILEEARKKEGEQAAKDEMVNAPRAVTRKRALKDRTPSWSSPRRKRLRRL